MGAVLCEFNSINGNNTAVVTRSGMGKSYPSMGTLIKKNCPGGKFYIESTDGGTNNYYRLIDPQNYTGIKTTGKVYVWISTTYLLYPKPADIKSAGSASATSVQNTPASTTPTTPNSSAYSQGLDDQIYKMLNTFKLNDVIKSSTRIFGTPFQFTNTADYRPFVNENLDYGRKYLENIIAEAPIVYLTPGLPNYMPDADPKAKESVDAFIKARSAGIEIGNDAMKKLLQTEARYYDFTPAYSEYIRYVNLLCRVSAIYMGLTGINPATGQVYTVPNTTTSYDKYDWGKWSNLSYETPEEDKVQSKSIFGKAADWLGDSKDKVIDKLADDLFGEYRFLKCYVDPSLSFNESSGNSTQQSMVAGLFDNLESIVKEVGFFSNGGNILDGAVSGAKSAISSTLDATTALDKDSNVGLSKIIGNASHVIAGSNIAFPELWGDSSYNKSYSFTINLISPYGDPESVYLNIIVPMMHLIAMSMPRQTSANSFGSPFIVKAFAKGWFSCEMGMIDNISIEKEPSSWNIYGLPNEVKVSISITDLYKSLSVSKSSAPSLFFSNQGLIEFLAVTCGLNITQGNIGLKIYSILSVFNETLFDIPSNVYDNFINGIRNSIEPWYKITR